MVPISSVLQPSCADVGFASSDGGTGAGGDGGDGGGGGGAGAGGAGGVHFPATFFGHPAG